MTPEERPLLPAAPLLREEPRVLAPLVVAEIRNSLDRLRESGLTMLVVEQKLDIALGDAALPESKWGLPMAVDLHAELRHRGVDHHRADRGASATVAGKIPARTSPTYARTASETATPSWP